MNEIIHEVVSEDSKRYVFAIDPITGEQIKIELAGTGEFSQDLDDAPAPEGVTIH